MVVLEVMVILAVAEVEVLAQLVARVAARLVVMVEQGVVRQLQDLQLLEQVVVADLDTQLVAVVVKAVAVAEEITPARAEVVELLTLVEEVEHAMEMVVQVS
jgi:hypothetical protein